MNSNHKALLATAVFYLLIWLTGQVIWQWTPPTNNLDFYNEKTISIKLQETTQKIVKTEKIEKTENLSAPEPKNETFTSNLAEKKPSETDLAGSNENTSDTQVITSDTQVNTSNTQVNTSDTQINTSNTQVNTDNSQGSSPSNFYPSIPTILEKKIEKMLIYPPAAKKRGIQGSITIQITIDTAGNFEFQQIISSSGSNILDTEAKKLVEKLFPLEIQDGFNLQYAQKELPFTNTITISYVLN